MVHKSSEQRKKYMRIMSLFFTVLLLAGFVLPYSASATDEEISDSPICEAALDDVSELTDEIICEEVTEESTEPPENTEPEIIEEAENSEEAETGDENAEEAETEAEITEIPEEVEEAEDAEETEEETKQSALLAAVPAVFSDSAQDANYIVVEKRFAGLNESLIPPSFQISVSSTAQTYVLNADNTADRRSDADGVVWSWRIIGVGTGTYAVSESGEAVYGYNVTKAGEGTVTVKAADMTVYVPVHETTCSHTNWSVKVDGDSNIMFAATLTQGGVAVISKTPLSASQRAAVSQAVLKINGPWKNPVYFYSIQEQLQNGTGFELNGATITYDSSAEEVIIGRTSNWQHVATVKYSVSEADNPEIALVNTYERAVSDVTVSKSVSGWLGDYEKSFDFAVSVRLGGSDAEFTLNGTRYTGTAYFSLKNGESVCLRDIPLGASVTVTEADYSADGYAASHSVNGQFSTGSTAELEAVTAGENTVHFRNVKDISPDTGVELDAFPYILILITATAGAFTLLLKRRESR